MQNLPERKCHAQVYKNLSETDLCGAPTAKGNRLCRKHIREAYALQLEMEQRYVISVSVGRFNPKAKKRIIGILFNTKAQAQTWCRLNSTLIFRIPGVRSYCIEGVKI